MEKYLFGEEGRQSVRTLSGIPKHSSVASFQRQSRGAIRSEGVEREVPQSTAFHSKLYDPQTIGLGHCSNTSSLFMTQAPYDSELG